MEHFGTISILVAVYNVSKYIRQCVESVINQTYIHWELILVDDGSTDDCPIICEKFAEQDKRIKVVHKINGGLASTRNAGLDAASGDWVMMLDGDDWLSTNALSMCINVLKDRTVDFVKFSHKLEYIKRSVDVSYPHLDSKEQYIESMLNRTISVSIWGGLYKRELFRRLMPIFTDGLNYGEDYSVTPRLLYLAQRPIFLRDCLYHYRVLNNSYVGSYKWSNIEQLIECEKIVYNFFVNRNELRYIKPLKRGHVWIKKLALEYIVSDYVQNKYHIEKIRLLYHNDLDYSGCNIVERIFLLLASNKLTINFLVILQPVMKKIKFMIKNFIGMNRG